MSTPNRRLASALEALHKRYPQWRFGQLVANLATWAKGPAPEAIWDVTDSELLEAAEAHLRSTAHGDQSKIKKAG